MTTIKFEKITLAVIDRMRARSVPNATRRETLFRISQTVCKPFIEGVGSVRATSELRSEVLQLQQDIDEKEIRSFFGDLSRRDRFSTYEAFVNSVAAMILEARKTTPGRTYLVVIVGNSGSGKSYARQRVGEAVVRKGGKIIILKRDWFIGRREDGKRFYRSEDIKRVLRQIYQFRESNEEETTVALPASLNNYDGPSNLLVDRQTIVIVDGLREIESEMRNFDFKILLLANPTIAYSRKREREKAKGKDPGMSLEKSQRMISQWIEDFWKTSEGLLDFDAVVLLNDFQQPTIFLPRLIVDGVELDIHREKKDRIVISRSYPDKKLALEDFLRVNRFNPSDGIYIGNETSLGGIDYPATLIKGLTVVAVDSEKRDAQASLVYAGKESNGTFRALQRLKELCAGEKPKEGDPLDETLIKLTDRNRPHFIASDIDDTLTAMDTKGGKSIRRDILDLLISLIREGFYAAFITKNNEEKAWKRVGSYLSQRLVGNEKERITFYTSMMVKKMRLSPKADRFDFMPGDHEYYSLTMVPLPTKKRLSLLLEKICQRDFPDLCIEERGLLGDGRITQFRITVPVNEMREQILRGIERCIINL